MTDSRSKVKDEDLDKKLNEYDEDDPDNPLAKVRYLDRAGLPISCFQLLLKGGSSFGNLDPTNLSIAVVPSLDARMPMESPCPKTPTKRRWVLSRCAKNW